MGTASIEQLQAADTKLTRSFICCVVAVLASMGWALFVSPSPGRVDRVLVIIGAVQIACFVWYAFCAGAAADLVGAVGWHYILWIIAAPFLALIPIPVVSTIIGVSPLSIKFLLGGQLQTAIRQETMAVLRPTS